MTHMSVEFGVHDLELMQHELYYVEPADPRFVLLDLLSRYGLYHRHDQPCEEDRVVFSRTKAGTEFYASIKTRIQNTIRKAFNAAKAAMDASVNGVAAVRDIETLPHVAATEPFETQEQEIPLWPANK